MDDSQLRALREAANDGVACDGLSATRGESGYVFETPEVSHKELSESEFDALATENPWFVSNWHYWRGMSETNGEFLRWVEHAAELGVRERYETLVAGLAREWGQLLITTTLGTDGERSYELRHTADAETAAERLDTNHDPTAARDIATLDEQRQYRPLKTAPTLRQGWRFADLDGRGLVRTVEFFYPATVANWYRERVGELDVTHFRETAERQTGIYDVVDDLDVDGVERLAETCCVDSQCLKRREWDEDSETALDVPRGDGEFPCREPCSLVVAAARRFAILESEQSRTYELELTPSERSQVGELVDAVAEGRVDEIREADLGDGANRYRARYLRAKRLAEGEFESLRERD
jgi:hypothetical protein